MRMLKFVADSDRDVVIVIAQGLGHLRFNQFSDQVLRGSLSRTSSVTERAKMYALGMTGSPAMQHIVKSPQAPEWQKSAARWWLQHGPAIRH